MKEISPPTNDPSLSLAAKVAFLKRPASYPERPQHVESIETHMSWVFLTDKFAYKLKKPVQYPFLDFRTLQARQRSCAEEIRLNRRLAPATYLAVVSLNQSHAGTLNLAGDGEPVDWLVKMRRLPASRMLDAVIRDDRATEPDIREVATLLCKFYRQAPPEQLTGSDYRGRFAEWINANGTILRNPDYCLPTQMVDAVTERQSNFVRQSASILDRRISQGKIIEAHGDLRPEHVFLGPPPQVIDCLEFNRTFRIMDPVDELCFLSLECELQGAPIVEKVLFKVYSELTDDTPPKTLISFYKCYRATLRAKLSVWHVADPDIDDTEKWIRRGQRYLDAADRYARDLR